MTHVRPRISFRGRGRTDGRSSVPPRFGFVGQPLADRLPLALALLLVLPVAVGLAGTVLPAFGYLPALGGEGLTLRPFRDLLAEPGLGRSVLLSFATGLLATGLSLGGVLLFVAALAGTRRLEAVRPVLAPLLAVPHAASAFGLAFLVAPSGLLFRLAAPALGLDAPPDLLVVGDRLGLAMTAGLVLKEIPFLLLVTLAALPRTDAERRLAVARSLGYGRMRGFLLAVWPSLYRQIRLPVLAVAAFASSVVDVAQILGPSTPAPLAVRVLAWMRDPDLALRFQASAGALLQLAVTLAVLAAWIAGERLGRRLLRRALRSGRRGPDDGLARRLAPLPVLLSGAAALAGLLLVLLWSVAGSWPFPAVLPASFTAASWSRALSRIADPARTTVLLGALSALAALVLVVALLEALRRRQARDGEAGVAAALPASLAALLYVPLVVPQVSFLFGIDVALLSLGASPGLLLVALVHLVFVAPYLALALEGPWFALDPRYERTAASLGHGPLARFLRVRLPLLAAPVLAALAIGFAVSAGQYLPTLIIGGGRLPTLTTEAVALASGGDRRLAGVHAALQALPPLLAFALALLVPAWLGRRRRRAGAPA